jgi:hypothetical protein
MYAFSSRLKVKAKYFENWHRAAIRTNRSHVEQATLYVNERVLIRLFCTVVKLLKREIKKTENL